MISRITIARVVAVSADAIQWGLLPFFFEGSISPLNAALDVVVGGVLTWLVGWHIAFLPSFVFEALPFVDLAPTWTIAVLIATRKKTEKPLQRVDAHAPGPAPASSSAVPPRSDVIDVEIVPEKVEAPPLIDRGMRSGWGERGAIGWPQAIMWIAIVAIAAFCALFMFKSCMDAPVKLLHELRKENVTVEFREYCAEVHSNLALQVATLKQMEMFTRSDEAVLGNYIPLPEVIVSVTAPVEYVYSLDLNDKWTFELKDDTLRVRAPDPKSGSPSFDVSKMKWIVEKDSMIRNTTSVKEELQKSLMPMATQRGRANVWLIRETARAQTALFVERWLKERFQDGSKYRVQVEFAGDASKEGPHPVALPR
jgi:hypothetical protein